MTSLRSSNAAGARALPLWLSVVFVLGCFNPSSERCTNDSTCMSGFTCVEGKCTAPAAGGSSQGGGDSSTAGGVAAGGSADAGGTASAGGAAAGGTASAGGMAIGGGDGGGSVGGGDSGGSGAGGSGAGGSGAGGSGAGGSGAGGSGAGGSGAGGSGAGGSGAGGSGAGGSGAGGSGAGSVPGDTCTSPIAITAAGVVMGTTLGARADYSQSANSCLTSDGRDVVFQVNVPAASTMVVTATPSSSSFDLVLNLVSDASRCASSTGLECLSGVDVGSAGRPETLTFTNGGSARSVLLIVDGWALRDQGAFSLDVRFQPIVTGDVCELPIALTPGTPLTSQALAGFSEDYGFTTEPHCAFHDGIDRAYSVVVPAGQRLTATVTPVGFDASLTLVQQAANCSANVCLVGAENSGSGAAETLRWDNVSTSAQTVLLVVDAFTTSRGTFSIGATLAPSPQSIVGGSSCSAPVPLDAGTFISVTAGASGFDFPEEGGCVSSSTAPDTVFSVTIPPNSMVRTQVAADGWDAIINVIANVASCGLTLDAGTLAATCLTSSDGPMVSSVESVTVRNPTATATSALLIIDGHQDTEFGSFSITHEVLPLVAIQGDFCAAPQAITTSGLISGLTTTGYVDDVQTASGCTSFQNRGPDRIFSISVPAGKQLTAVAIPNGWDASIYILDPAQCGMNASCLNGSDSSTSGAETVRFTNSGTTARDVLIVVDSYSSGLSGSFDLLTNLTP